MNCDKIVYGVFRPTIQGTVHLRNNILDYEACNKLCEVVASAKSYFYYGKTRDCHCLSTSFAENIKHMEKFGAPKGCPISLGNDSCVSKLCMFSSIREMEFDKLDIY
jgi:hypothetical protein